MNLHYSLLMDRGTYKRYGAKPPLSANIINILLTGDVCIRRIQKLFLSIISIKLKKMNEKKLTILQLIELKNLEQTVLPNMAPAFRKKYPTLSDYEKYTSLSNRLYREKAGITKSSKQNQIIISKKKTLLERFLEPEAPDLQFEDLGLDDLRFIKNRFQVYLENIDTAISLRNEEINNEIKKYEEKIAELKSKISA